MASPEYDAGGISQATVPVGGTASPSQSFSAGNAETHPTKKPPRVICGDVPMVRR